MFDFDEIRPYNDAEAKEAYYRLTEDPRFQDAIAKFLPHYSAEELRRDLPKFNTVDEIQADFIRRWIAQISAFFPGYLLTLLAK